MGHLYHSYIKQPKDIWKNHVFRKFWFHHPTSNRLVWGGFGNDRRYWAPQPWPIVPWISAIPVDFSEKIGGNLGETWAKSEWVCHGVLKMTGSQNHLVAVDGLSLSLGRIREKSGLWLGLSESSPPNQRVFDTRIGCRKHQHETLTGNGFETHQEHVTTCWYPTQPWKKWIDIITVDDFTFEHRSFPCLLQSK